MFPLSLMAKHISFVGQYLLHQLITQQLPYWVALSKLLLLLDIVDIVMELNWIYNQRCNISVII